MVTEIGVLAIESDFPLFSNGEMHESVQHVRLITIVERES